MKKKEWKSTAEALWNLLEAIEPLVEASDEYGLTLSAESQAQVRALAMARNGVAQRVGTILVKKKEWKERAMYLCMLLNQIDAFDDWAKGDDLAFRDSTMAVVKKRHKAAPSDGYAFTWGRP